MLLIFCEKNCHSFLLQSWFSEKLVKNPIAISTEPMGETVNPESPELARKREKKRMQTVLSVLCGILLTLIQLLQAPPKKHGLLMETHS